MSFDLKARQTGATIEFYDNRTGQVLCTMHPSAGVAIDGVTIPALSGGAHTSALLSGDGSVGSPLTLATSPAAAVALVAAIPTADQHDSATIWNNGGVLKVSGA